jgi:trehalose 2-sulfotransferase
MYTQHKLDHEFKEGAETVVSYAVCALPRSGSSLLCELLFTTDLAGAPGEYFDAAMMKRFRRRWGAESFDDYLRTLLAKKTGPNGAFGFKAHFFQLIEAFPGSSLEAAFPRLRHVYITREDRLRQAISWARAIQTHRWSSEQEVYDDNHEIFRREQIDRMIAGITERERRWEALFADCGADPLRITYEELVARPEETVAAVLGHIGVEDPVGVRLAGPTLRRQADGLTEEWVSRYRAGALQAATGVA